MNYKLRDWVFSPPALLGEPIPLVYCEHVKVPLPLRSLPLMLPRKWRARAHRLRREPAGGDDRLGETPGPCGGAAKRETDTMPQWAGSRWYFLRYPTLITIRNSGAGTN